MLCTGDRIEGISQLEAELLYFVACSVPVPGGFVYYVEADSGHTSMWSVWGIIGEKPDSATTSPPLV